MNPPLPSFNLVQYLKCLTNKDMSRNYKAHISCQIFPKVDNIYLGAVFTPKETLVCCAADIPGIKKSLSIAVQEVCQYIDGEMSEKQFEDALRERESIMRGIIEQHNIPLDDDLYRCLTDYFPNVQEAYMPFESTSSYTSDSTNLERGLYTSIYWDDRKMKFVPTNFIERAPMFKTEDCLEICEQLTVMVASSWEPKQGDVYYHPVTWVPGKNFVPMNNQASVDGCPYPAFKTLEECHQVCDKMNNYLESKLI